MSSKSQITIQDYSEKSFVLRGETKDYKDQLSTLGGKWNSRLKDGAGWIFSNKLKDKIQAWLADETPDKEVAVVATSKSSTNMSDTDRLEKKLDRILLLLEKNSITSIEEEDEEDEKPPTKRLLGSKK